MLAGLPGSLQIKFIHRQKELGLGLRQLGREPGLSCQHILDFASRNRPAEEIALHLSTAETGQYVQLFGCLNPLGKKMQSESMSNTDYGAYDRRSTLNFGQITDKRLIDLDGADRQAAQVIER